MARQHEHADRDERDDVPVQVDDRHTPRGAQEAQDVHDAEGQWDPHDGPGLREFPQRRYDREEGALEDAEADARQAVGKEDEADPSLMQVEDEQRRDDRPDKHERHGDVDPHHRRQEAEDDVVPQPGDHLAVVHEDGRLCEDVRHVAHLADAELRLELLLRRADHAGVALEDAHHREHHRADGRQLVPALGDLQIILVFRAGIGRARRRVAVFIATTGGHGSFLKPAALGPGKLRSAEGGRAVHAQVAGGGRL
mmetsp:Transcript_30495/g.87072  ORF Transcript_30495/g.87072 Transcript_30495/m.87072 type:complete len:253 (-) Transcript_30495:3-761(-)